MRTRLTAMILTALAMACGPQPRPFTPQPAPELFERGPLPLDEAVMRDEAAAVRALLEAGVSPNPRWTRRGDRFPLEEAIEAPVVDQPHAHRAESIQLLLAHGADPNARWCPRETREGPRVHSQSPPCTTAAGVTPLIMAALLDDPGTMALLLAAKADPLLEDWYGATALDYVRSEAALAVLLPAMFPNVESRDADALAYLEGRHHRGVPRGRDAGPWDSSPLARAICCPESLALPPPAPGESRANGRPALLLRLGANPNQRLGGRVDWTPLALAVSRYDAAVVEALLAAGADPNGRWCVALRPYDVRATWVPDPACEATTGTTALMLAESLGHREHVRLLLAHGADPSLRDWRGRTAADYQPVARTVAP